MKLFTMTLCLGFLLSYTLLFGQLKIGGDPYKIHSFALLDLESSDKGVLLPRMTTEQKDKAFTSQIPEGLLLFNTDLQLLKVYTASLGWQPVAFVESDAFQVRWESHQLLIGDYPSIYFTPYLPRPNQQLHLTDHILHIDQGG